MRGTGIDVGSTCLCLVVHVSAYTTTFITLFQVAKGRSIAGSESVGKKELEEERSLQLMGMAGTVDVVASMVKAADLEELEGEMAMAPRREDSRRRYFIVFYWKGFKRVRDVSEGGEIHI